MLVDLMEHSRRGAGSVVDADADRRIWASAFGALAVAVPQYRTIGLFHSDGSLEVSARDPTETDATSDALLSHSAALAIAVAKTGEKALGKPAVRYRDRSFLLYGTPVRGGAIVVASDAALFLREVTWTPSPLARLFVTDPAGVVWSGCETPSGCRADTSDAVQRHLHAGPTRVVQVPAPIAQALGLAGAPAVQISEPIARPTGNWTVTRLASSQTILARGRAHFERVLATTMAAALAVAVVGIVILRQQRKAVALEGRLQYAQALASAREISESIVENAPLGVLGVSRDGRVVLANGFLTDRIGAIRIGAPLRDAFSGEGVDLLRHLEPMLMLENAPARDDPNARTPARAGASAIAAPVAPGPRELRSLSTASHHFYVRLVPVRNQELGIRAFALIEDQSVLRSLENQLVRAEKLITVGVLSAGIAHEIGSPLAVIRGRAEQVLRATGPGPAADDLRVIIKHIDAISSTIRQLLDFSRRQPIARQAVSLATAVDRAKGLLQWKLEAKNLSLTVNIDDNLPRLAADPDQLQQVVVNLLLNACDASEPGATLHVTGRTHGDGAVQLEVVDHGCGIVPAHMNAVFDPFFTTKKRGEGTGLGLSIVASIVRNHGGEINLGSEPGKGTTVSVRWPTDARGIDA